ATVLAATATDRFGGPAHKTRWLPAFASGRARGTVALLERDLAVSAEAIQTRAEQRGGKVALSGVKQFVPWAHVADVVLVPARAGNALAVYVVETSAPGLSITPLTGMDPGTRLAQVTLDGATVAAEARLPAEALSFLLLRGAVGAAAEVRGAARRGRRLAGEGAKVAGRVGQTSGSLREGAPQ